MMELSNLEMLNGMYFIGHIWEHDNDGWVNKEQALKILDILNQEQSLIDEFMQMDFGAKDIGSPF
jgi:hypothetical protein